MEPFWNPVRTQELTLLKGLGLNHVTSKGGRTKFTQKLPFWFRPPHGKPWQVEFVCWKKRTLLECTCETSRAAAHTPERLQTIRLFHSSTQTGEHCFTCPNVGQTQRPFWTTHGNPNALINHPFIHWIFGVGASILDGWHGVNMQGLRY